MLYSIVLLKEAVQEWSDATGYYDARRKGLGGRFAEEVEDCLRKIEKKSQALQKS